MITRARVLRRPPEDARSLAAAQASADPVALGSYLYSVWDAWHGLLLPVGATFIFLTVAGSILGGASGRSIGFALGISLAVPYLVGDLDAFWRWRCGLKARSLYLDAGLVADEQIRRLTRIARTANVAVPLAALSGLIALILALALTL